MKTFKQILDERGLTYMDIAKKGVPYQTVRKHYLGDRSITAQYAMIYERVAGIPKSELCPQFWEEESTNAT